jgi:hypothetical protein
MIIVGIDPGKTGAATFLSDNGEVVVTAEYDKLTPHEIVDVFHTYSAAIKKVYIEYVASRPKQGVKSAFTFGANFGFWRGIVTALKLPYETVTPGTWQRAMGCLSKGNKKITKAKAQQLFPTIKITSNTADSILIAEYGWKKTIYGN